MEFIEYLLLSAFILQACSGAVRDLGELGCNTAIFLTKCEMNETCRARCRYSCLKMENLAMWGTEIYTYDTPVCKAAVHDRRASTWDSSAREVLVKRIPHFSPYRGSVRFGFRTEGYGTLGYREKGSFIFLNPRISEAILDVVSLHKNFLRTENETHVQECVQPAGEKPRRITFDTYMERSLVPSNVVADPRLVTRGDSEIFRMVWPGNLPLVANAGYQCLPEKSMLSIVTSLAFRKDAYFLPSKITITANVNETVTLEMNARQPITGNVQWKKDGQPVNSFVGSFADRNRLTLFGVQVGSSGIYSLEYDDALESFSRRGIVRLIVRACPLGFYGEICSHECPQCLNGGICHDITGVCICPPGFNGTICEKACPPGHFGKKCISDCSTLNSGAPDELCRGILICLPDPFGCSCAAGYTGADCNEKCKPQTFGAGCTEHRECYCADNVPCSRFSGLCVHGCMPGWHGSSCEKSYPVIKQPPLLIDVFKTSAKIKFFAWTQEKDIGSGKAFSYVVVYKKFDETNWSYGPHVADDGSQTYTVDIHNLKAGYHYLVGIIVIEESGEKNEANITVLHFLTLCDRPSLPPSGIQINTGERFVNISWNLPPSETWNCWNLLTIIYYNSSDVFQVERLRTSSYGFISKPFTHWNLKLCISPPYNDSISLTCTEVFNVVTKEDSPGYVTSLSLLAISSNTVTLHWNEPLEKNGKLRHYIINYKQVGWKHICNLNFDSTTKSTNVNDLSSDIKDLRASAVYSVEVLAVTVAQGPAQVITVETERDVPYGAPSNIKLISRRNGITWEEPLCNLTNGGVTNYSIAVTGLEMWDTEERRWATSELHFLFTGLISYTKYFLIMAAGNEIGLSHNFAQLMFTTYPSVPPPPSHPVIYFKSMSSLLLSWLPPYPPHGQLELYSIVLQDQADIHAYSLNASLAKCTDEIRKTSHCYAFMNLKSNCEYKIKIIARNEHVLVESEPLIILGETSESTPDAPSAAYLVHRTNTSLTIHWDEPYNWNGNLTSYRLTATVLDNFNLSYIGYKLSVVITDVNIRNYTFDALAPATTYLISVDASTKAGFGNSFEFLTNTSISVPVIENEPVILRHDGCKVTIHLYPTSMSGGPISAYFIVVNPSASHSHPMQSYTHIFNTINCTNATYKDRMYIAGKIEHIPETGANFTVGDGSCTDGYFNSPLKIGLVYRIGLVAFRRYGDEENYSKIKYISEPILVSYGIVHQISRNSGVVLGVIIPIIIILGVGALFLYFKKPHLLEISQIKMKILPSIKTHDEFGACNEALDEFEMIETESLCEELSDRISVKDLESYVWCNIQNSKIKKEYLSLPKGQKYPCNAAKLPENKLKNRYASLLPYDHSRVILDIISSNPHSDYINANYIDGYRKEKKYIATQGPKITTIDDFWRMVWKESSCKLIMVANLVEGGKTKCEKYWTENSQTYGEISVVLESFEPYTDYVIRTFKLFKCKEVRELKHYHFLTWPDHGVPTYSAPVVDLLKKVRTYKPSHEAPVIVHCSAGIGRTGTIILLDSMFEMGSKEGYVDIIGQLCTMRRQRSNIVENYDQYLFVHNALLDVLCREETRIPCSDFVSHLKKLQHFDEELGVTLFEKQLMALDKQTFQLQRKDMRAAHSPENRDKNRTMDILPPERSRPILRTLLHAAVSGYINAVYIDGYRQKDAFIVTQCPLPNTMEDFWRMVVETKSKSIVLLQNLDFSYPDHPRYWPSEGSAIYGDFQVDCQTIATDNNISVTTLLLTTLQTSSPEQPMLVKLFHLLRWPSEEDLPEGPDVMLHLMDKVERWQLQASQHIITVQCLDGASACGVFCAAMILCNQIKSEQEIDVFQAVKSIRVNRPKFIKNLAQYEFLHNIVMAYLDMFETYANFQ